MKKELADALLEFYQKILKPEFDTLKQQHADHEARLNDIYGHLDAIYRRLERLEDEQLVMNNRLSRIEAALKLGGQSHDQLEKRVREMKEQMVDLQRRIDSIEHQLNSEQSPP